MWEIETTFLTAYVDQIGQAFTAFIPLWSATVGVFLAFAMANMIRFFISRMIRQ
jgi:hypothetical protein